MSVPDSPQTSSGDEFAALLDTELQSDKQSSPSEGSAEEIANREEEEEGGGGDGDGEDLYVDEEELLGFDVQEEEEFVPEWKTKITAAAADGVDKKQEEEEAREGERGASCPPHPGFMWGVCIRCGQQKAGGTEEEEMGVALRYIHEGLELTEREAARMRRDELERLKSNKKLYLVLDLDHTLLNSARFVEVSAEEDAYISAAYLGLGEASSGDAACGASEALSNGRSKGTLHKLVHLQMWTKLRPFVHTFLEEASKLFEMYVYTMGERIYALAMAKLLDPNGRFFGDRVISQGDSTRRNTKDLDIVLGAESAVIIMDDTEGVWPKQRGNLMLMERYHFFSSSCRQFGIQALSLSEADKDESEEEGILATALHTLRTVHTHFYSLTTESCNWGQSSSADVRTILAEARSRVLKGCRIVFSRIFPTAYPNPESHPFWRLTEELGASCSSRLDNGTTHVVALDRGTDKARWAKSKGKFLVHPSWVEAAQYLWRRPSEADFPVADDGRTPPVTTFVKTVEVTGRRAGTPQPQPLQPPEPNPPEMKSEAPLSALGKRSRSADEQS